jgi:inorganic pyrophosphatase
MFKHITIGHKSPKIINVIIEIPKDSHNKYEYDEELDLIKLDRVLHSPMHYPVDYGFAPETRSEDGDHLDILILTNSPVFPGCLLEVRPIGALIMSDEHGKDEKILAVPAHNPTYHQVKSLKDIPLHVLNELEHFFAEYKFLEKKENGVKIEGWINRLETYRLIKKSQKKYFSDLQK